MRMGKIGSTHMLNRSKILTSHLSSSIHRT
jgi:hypothetical protein